MDRFTIADALELLRAKGEDYSRLLERPDFDLGLYRPDRADVQSPHSRDELYIVASGRGVFLCGGERTAFAPGDVFFVPAGIEHRFEDFSEDFSTWVVFFGTRKE